MPYHLTRKNFVNKDDCPKYCLSEQQFRKWKVKRDLAESLYKALSFECLKSRIQKNHCRLMRSEKRLRIDLSWPVHGYFLRTEMDAFLCVHRNTRLSVDLQMLSGSILTFSLKKKWRSVAKCACSSSPAPFEFQISGSFHRNMNVHIKCTAVLEWMYIERPYLSIKK